jgi:hypothetical protein
MGTALFLPEILKALSHQVLKTTRSRLRTQPHVHLREKALLAIFRRGYKNVVGGEIIMDVRRPLPVSTVEVNRCQCCYDGCFLKQ